LPSKNRLDLSRPDYDMTKELPGKPFSEEGTRTTALETIRRVVGVHSEFWACLRDLENEL